VVVKINQKISFEFFSRKNEKNNENRKSIYSSAVSEKKLKIKNGE